MAQKKPYRRPLSLIRLRFCCSDIVEFSCRKLIIFVLLQLLLSPFILITGDSINESVHNAIHSLLVNNSIPNSHVDKNPAVNDISDQFNGNKSELHATNRKFNDGNSISIENEIGTVEGKIFDGNLSSIENASLLGQSRPDCNTKRCAHEWRTHNNIFNNDTNDMANNNERILSRKRRYLIFPPGSSMQIGNSTLIDNIVCIIHSISLFYMQKFLLNFKLLYIIFIDSFQQYFFSFRYVSADSWP